MMLGDGFNNDDDPKKFDDVPLVENNNDNNIQGASNSTFLPSSSSSSSLTNSLLQLRIKSFKDVEVAVPNNSNVQQLKELVKHALGRDQTDDRYMRLICKGKLLHPDTSPLTEFKVHNDDVVHAVLAAKGVRPPAERIVTVVQTNATTNSTATSSSSTTAPATTTDGNSTGGINQQPQQGRRRRGGTVIGPGGRVTRLVQRNTNNNSNGWNIGGGGGRNGNDDDSFSSDAGDDDDSTRGDIENGGGNNTASSSSRRGFDRLRSAGLSRQEITAIRTYFNRNVDRYVQQHPQDHQDEPDLRRRRLLFEEDWMSTQSPTSEFRLNLNQNTLLRFASLTNGSGGSGGSVNWNTVHRSSSVGTDRDFMWGFLLGFFVGFVMLVWVWMPTVPHKQKIGILAGITFSLAANVLNDAEPDDLLD